MLKQAFFFALVGCACAGPAIGQESGSPVIDNPELASARLLLQAGREEIIREEIYLTEAEAAAFWPTYRAYVTELQPLRDRRTEAIAAFLLAYGEGTVSAADAERLVDEHLGFLAAVLEVKRRHLPNFRAALPPHKAARFYQLENKLDAELEAELAVFVPLIDPV